MKEAKFYKKLKGSKVQCNLCARNCIITENKTGSCSVRKNIKGKLYSLVYARPCSIAVDPIEKKPLYHFAPDTRTLSIATVGCNFHCKFCQNNDISQPVDIIGEKAEPKKVIELAKQYNAQGISYTYTEPTIFYEYAYDTAKLAAKEGLYNTFITNGYINLKPLEQVAKYLDAANVDLKSFSDSFYRKYCEIPSVKPVLQTINRMHDLGIHVEVTNLLIPKLNTSEKQIKQIAQYIYNIDKNIPLHFSRFYPMYKLTNISSTSTEILERAYKISKKVGLNYVYLGNIHTDKGNTYCPKCNSLLIERNLMKTEGFRLKNSKCFKCKSKIPIKGLKFMS